MFAEFLISMRRWEVWKRPSKPAGSRLRRMLWPDWRTAAVLVLYAATRSMGYWVMLISMMYSVEMFMALIAGLTIGHAVFNLDAAPGEDATPCCQAGSAAKSSRNPARVARAAVEMRDRGESGNTVVLKVEGMTCGACETTVSNAVSARPEVVSVSSCSHVKGEVEVVLSSHVPEHTGAENVRQAVEQVGFVATVVPATAKSSLV